MSSNFPTKLDDDLSLPRVDNNLTGESMVLLKRSWDGIKCKCFLPTNEHADDRCVFCYSTGFVLGYKQFFNPRRSDGRILVRVSPYDDTVKIHEVGYESEAILDCWTLTVPSIKNRDILVRYDIDNNEEFRYEVLSVNRNKTILGMQGAQKFKMQRVRKFDPAYKIRLISDTSTLPSVINTGISSSNGLPLHKHEIVISEKITTLNQINQTTSISAGHNHIVRNGIIQPGVLGHVHALIIS